MKLELKRKFRDGEILDGILCVNGKRLCDTSENGYSALPPGTYQVERRYCKHYCQHRPVIVIDRNACCDDCPQIGNEVFLNTVLPVYCPQIKMGNGIHNRHDGSVIIGKRVVPGVIKLPAVPYEKLTERMRKLAPGSAITLQIK